jgi:signal peptidase I
MAGVVYVFFLVFLFASFKIPSVSMSPSLDTGDHVLVFKPILGPLLFNLFTTLRGEQVEIYRAPGIRKVKRNDIVVLNSPHPGLWDKIEMHIMKYYIKRCIGLPGDTVQVNNGFYSIRGVDELVGNREAQDGISKRDEDSFDDSVYYTFPEDSVIHWNIKNFGPLYIPKENDVISMNRTHYVLYRKLIEWEQKTVLSYQDSVIYLNEKPLKSYQFQKNYYFMAGDRVEDSQDSRYWGLLPEEYIVGKAWIIWKSVDPYTGKFKWDRFLKKIN